MYAFKIDMFCNQMKTLLCLIILSAFMYAFKIDMFCNKKKSCMFVLYNHSQIPAALEWVQKS